MGTAMVMAQNQLEGVERELGDMGGGPPGGGPLERQPKPCPETNCCSPWSPCRVHFCAWLPSQGARLPLPTISMHMPGCNVSSQWF